MHRLMTVVRAARQKVVPRGAPIDELKKRRGRGYIDLLGIDGHGDVRIVETKIADNRDDLLILQGLDYYVWAKAYRQVLLARLGASDKADFGSWSPATGTCSADRRSESRSSSPQLAMCVLTLRSSSSGSGTNWRSSCSNRAPSRR